MAETTYKKGELLLDETIVTMNDDNYSTGFPQTQVYLNQDVLIIECNNIEYTCEGFNYAEGYPNVYGAISSEGTVDFSICPFIINNEEYGNSEEDISVHEDIVVYTENPGTYSFKIYTAIPDSDSSSEPVTIRSYIDKNLANLNWNILPQIFESEGVELTEEIERYLRETPKNTNWNVLSGLGGNEELITITFEYDQRILGTTSGLKGEEIQLPAFIEVSSWYTDSACTIFVGSEADFYTLDSSITLYGKADI